MEDEGFGLFRGGLEAAEGGYCVLERVVEIGSLAGVRVAGGFLCIGYLGDVDIVCRRGELDGVFPVGDFEVVKSEAVLELLPGFEGEVGDGAVVGMVVDGPVGDDGVGSFGFDNFLEGLVVVVVDDGVSVLLVGVEWAGFEDLAGAFGFGDANVGGSFPGAVVEVEEGDVVSGGGEAGDGASGGVFGVAGVATCDYNFIFTFFLG